VDVGKRSEVTDPDVGMRSHLAGEEGEEESGGWKHRYEMWEV
jgi:hypothetical protein